MDQKLLLKTVVQLSFGCALIAVLTAVASVFVESEFFSPLFNACLSLFTFGIGTIFGLIGNSS